jgi:hypothetical protein
MYQTFVWLALPVISGSTRRQQKSSKEKQMKLKLLVAVFSVALMVGCAGTSFNLGDNPVLNTILLACGDVPIAEFPECVQDLQASSGAEEMTVAELVEILKALNPTPEAPVE